MSGFCSGKAIPKRDYGDSAWDDAPCPQDLLDSLIAFCPDQIVWGGNYFDLGPARCYLVWDKLRGETDYADGELAWTNLDKAVRIIRWRWNGFLEQNQGDKDERYYPTQKPEAVMKWAICQAPEHPVIFDPFMGSGTTLRDAKDLGRRAIGIELEEKYCEIAVKRCAQKVFTWKP